jgi:hypothetical protein
MVSLHWSNTFELNPSLPFPITHQISASPPSLSPSPSRYFSPSLSLPLSLFGKLGGAGKTARVVRGSQPSQAVVWPRLGSGATSTRRRGTTVVQPRIRARWCGQTKRGTGLLFEGACILGEYDRHMASSASAQVSGGGATWAPTVARLGKHLRRDG